MTGGQLNANVDQYLQAAAMNTPPPQIVSDPLVTGVTPIEQLLRVLGLAANLGEAGEVGLGLDRKTLLLSAQGLGDRHQAVAAGIQGALNPADMV